MEHSWIKESLSAFIDNELTMKETAIIEAHLHECDSCRDEVESLKRVAQTINSLPEHSPSTPLIHEIMNEISSGKRKKRKKQFVMHPALMVLFLSLTVIFTYKLHPSQFETVIKTEDAVKKPVVEKSIAVKENKQETKTLPTKKIDNFNLDFSEAEKSIVSSPPAKNQVVLKREPVPHVLKRQRTEKFSPVKKGFLADETEADSSKSPAGISEKLRSSPETSRALGARKLDSEMFLSKEEYINNYVDKTLIIKTDNYNFIRNIIKKENDSFLESRVENMYEIQLHTTEDKWDNITEKINESYQMKKNTSDGIEIIEIFQK